MLTLSARAPTRWRDRRPTPPRSRCARSTLPLEAVARVEQILERYSSPYPDPIFLAKIEELAPGSAERIVTATLEDLQHRRVMDLRQADIKSQELTFVKDIAGAEVSSVKQGRWLGFFAYLACLGFSGAMYYAGSEKLAFAGFGAAAIGIVAQLIRGGSSGISITAATPPNDDDDDKLETPKETRPAKR